MIKRIIAISVIICVVISNMINIFAGGVKIDDKYVNVTGGSLLFESTDFDTGLSGYKGYPTIFTVPDKVTGLSGFSYWVSEPFNNVERDVTQIWRDAFAGSTCVKKVVIGTKIRCVGVRAFSNCPNLESFEIKSSDTEIYSGAFLNCPKLVLICPVGSKAETYAKKNKIPYKNWAKGTVYRPGTETEPTTVVTTTTTTETTTETTTISYEYNQKEKDVDIDKDLLDKITDSDSAISAVKDILTTMTSDEKKSPKAIDTVTLFIQEAISRACNISTDEKEIVVNKDMLSTCVSEANELKSNIEKELSDNGVKLKREIPVDVKIISSSDEEVSIKKSDNLAVDNIIVKTSYGKVSVSGNKKAEFTMSNSNGKINIKFEKKPTESIKISFDKISGNNNYMAVSDDDKNIFGGKYNHISGELTAKISESGIYSVVDNEKSFSDIKNKNSEIQEAIKTLASKGIISGTSESSFSPDKSISRAEVAAIILRTLSKLDANADGGFSDVTKENWFFGVAGSSKNVGIINGYEDNTFRGNVTIPKDQIVSVSARVLKNEMKYLTPSDTDAVLSVYGDSEDISQWAKEDVALATDANLVIKRTDGLFGGKEEMTRGDAAIILKRLFDRVW